MRITSNDVKKSVSKQLKQARKNLGYTQEYIADHIGVSVDMVRSIETGRNAGSITTLLNICNILKISPNTLFYELLDFREETKDSILNSYINKISVEDRKVLKKIIVHVDKNY